ncbi:unnamed protein product [Sphenostylis stenocarpa]|uniref:C3H1-type domain-containing protein n=1 Tax=Sphenostylis stenocarpa TaxID=92480 RepID=A0AA86TAF9_9FABA|nr:unnamed protein product [Sphenostylis stenocarpa]
MSVAAKIPSPSLRFATTKQHNSSDLPEPSTPLYQQPDSSLQALINLTVSMDLYGRGPARNGSNPVNQPEWRSPGIDTTLEGLNHFFFSLGFCVCLESMWHLTLGCGESYPERPGVPNCVYYMRTGVCGYGSRCRYNHPRDRAAVTLSITLRFCIRLEFHASVLLLLVLVVAIVAAAVRATGDYPERVGEPPCQYYLKTGTCKFGASCKFHHPRNGGGYLSQAPLNTYGYPLRPGERECSYYLKTGQCKFGITCKFHHPQPVGTPLPASAPQFYQQVQSPSVPLPEQYGGASTNLRVARPPVMSGSYVQGAYGPVLLSPGVVQFPGWSHYSAPVSPALSPGAQPGVGATSLYGVTQLSSPTSAFARPYTPLSSTTGPSGNILKDQLFPERPGEPECQYYLRTGDCKYGLACRYHHPRDHIVARPLLSPIGLPLRPDQDGLQLIWTSTEKASVVMFMMPNFVGLQPCAFYLQNGHCKFGSTCKFDHPLGSLSYSPSVSSFTDVPVTPYPVGSLLSQLAPSTTSSEFRPELMSGSKKESLSARISSSDTPVGLIFSQGGGSVSLSDVQLSSQSSAPLSSSRSTRQSSEIR